MCCSSVPDWPGEETPLCYAAATGNIDRLRALIRAGCFNFDVERSHGKTPLLWAVSEKNSTCVIALLRSGAGVDVQGQDGDTPLILSAKLGDIRSLRYLIEFGANLDCRVSKNVLL